MLTAWRPSSRQLSLGVFALVLISFSTRAHAACTSLDAAGFEQLTADAEAAIDDDDLVRHGQVYRSMQEQLPCMDEKLPIDAWAEFLVGYAIVEYAMGREWEHALAVAVAIKPTVAHNFGPDEIQNYVPTAYFVDDSQPPLPDDAQIYLDGVPMKYERELGKIHIVQQFKNGVWNTRLLQDTPFPEDWRVQFFDEPEVADTDDEATSYAAVFALGGVALAGQSVIQGPTDKNIQDLNENGGLVGLGSYGAYFPSGPVGMFWDVSGPFSLVQGVGIEGYVGPAISVGALHIKPGMGVMSVVVDDIGETRTVMLPQSHVYADYNVPLADELGLDMGAGAGYWVSGWHAKARIGVHSGGPIGWNGGLELSGVTGLFEEPGGPADNPRLASVGAWRFGLRGGVSFGKR